MWYSDKLDHLLPLLSDSINASMEDTIQGFQILTYHTSPTFFQHLEISFKVSVCVYSSFTDIQSFSKQNIESVIEMLIQLLISNNTRQVSFNIASFFVNDIS